jgi:hypothetical protein
VKLLTTLLLAALGALAVYAARRRILFALKTGAVLYISLLFGRLALSFFSVNDRLDELIGPVVALVLVWAVLWWVSTTYAERRALRKQQEKLRSASGAGRPAR